MQGELWKQQRRFVHTALKDFGMGRSLLEGKIAEELSHFTARLRQLAPGPFNPRFTLQMTVANVIGSIVWGHRRGYDDPEFLLYMKIMARSFQIIDSAGALNAFPFLK